MPIRLRPVIESDMPFVLEGTRQLAVVEGRPGSVTATPETLWSLLSGSRPLGECVVIEHDSTPPVDVGHAWFYFHPSTFSGEKWLYLEDICIHQAHRSRGLGRLAMAALARLALERGCTGMHWSVVSGNDAAMRFYERLGAVPKTGIESYKLVDGALERLASRA
ncbi:MAG: GNAT family N-acetyltransferase [Phycisphaeraceae bacterium]|nr:GNAT family N-acetyltransferase [Phycisphaeraceae bacterium]